MAGSGHYTDGCIRFSLMITVGRSAEQRMCMSQLAARGIYVTCAHSRLLCLSGAIHREGPSKLPSERCLASEVAALSYTILHDSPEYYPRASHHQRFLWVPILFQMAYVMTKYMDATQLYADIRQGLIIVRHRVQSGAESCTNPGCSCVPQLRICPRIIEPQLRKLRVL